MTAIDGSHNRSSFWNPNCLFRFRFPYCVRSCIGTRLNNVQKVCVCDYFMDRKSRSSESFGPFVTP